MLWNLAEMWRLIQRELGAIDYLYDGFDDRWPDDEEWWHK